MEALAGGASWRHSRMSRYGKMLDISVRTDISSIPSGWSERRCAQVDIEYRGVAMVLVDNQVVGEHGGAQGGFHWLTKCVNHGNYTIFQIARTPSTSSMYTQSHTYKLFRWGAPHSPTPHKRPRQVLVRQRDQLLLTTY